MFSVQQQHKYNLQRNYIGEQHKVHHVSLLRNLLTSLNSETFGPRVQHNEMSSDCRTTDWTSLRTGRGAQQETGRRK